MQILQQLIAFLHRLQRQFGALGHKLTDDFERGAARGWGLGAGGWDLFDADVWSPAPPVPQLASSPSGNGASSHGLTKNFACQSRLNGRVNRSSNSASAQPALRARTRHRRLATNLAATRRRHRAKRPACRRACRRCREARARDRLQSTDRLSGRRPERRPSAERATSVAAAAARASLRCHPGIRR